MPTCEDFPCCGHESGCCPSYSESGEQLDMVCVCGARLPITSRYSICPSCMSQGEDGDDCYDERDDYEGEEEPFAEEDGCDDGESDACIEPDYWEPDYREDFQAD